jgi:lactoylglutathione lyase
MRYLHAMVRVLNLETSLDFYINKLGLKEIKRTEHEKGRFTLIFLTTGPNEPMIELTYNWDETTPYSVGRNFGHLAFEVDDIYRFCENLQAKGVTILRPPRDGYMAFIRSPDKISIELLQKGVALTPKEPWISMPNIGEW